MGSNKTSLLLVMTILLLRKSVKLDVKSMRSCVVSLLSQVKSVRSALSDLLTTSATHGTFSHPSTKRGLILIGFELNTNAREPFEHF